MFTGLTSLDGYRKTVKMACNMRDAIPEEEKIDTDYDTSHIEWYDKNCDEFTKVDPAADRFKDSVELKREESSLASILKDCKSLLDKKKNILTY